MTLREQLIEAGAKAIRQRVLPRGMERLATGEVIAQSLRDAEAALDAFLDTLEANPSMWGSEAWLHGPIHDLLAVLRDTGDSE